MMRLRRVALPTNHASRERMPRAPLRVPISAHWLDRMAPPTALVEFIIQPDDSVELRHFGDNEPRRIEPILPLFVSPLLIAFKTKHHGTIRVTKWQVKADAWRNLCVRLNHLRVDQAENISNDIR